MFKQRILLQLSVKGDIRFVSHHDLMRVLGRAARRAGLPVAMSEGFNPRQKISLLLARGVGVASESEFAEMDLDEWVSAGETARRLNDKLPEGLRVVSAHLGHPRERHRAVSIDYHVSCRGELTFAQHDAETLLGGPEVWVRRVRRKAGKPTRVRRVNIRPLIKSIHVDERSVDMSLMVSDQGTTRPEEVWEALGGNTESLLAECSVTRTDMKLSPPL